MNYVKVQRHIGVAEFRKGLSAYLKESKHRPVIVRAGEGDSRIMIDTDFYNELIDSYEANLEAKHLMAAVEENKGKRGVSLDNFAASYGV